MIQKRLMLILCLALALLLVACGGDEEEPAAETSGETAVTTTDPAADFQTISSDVLGVTVGYPADWTAEVSEFGDIQIASDAAILASDSADLLAGASVVITSFEAEMIGFLDENADPSDPVSVLTTFADLIAEDDTVTFTTSQAAAATSVAGKSGARMGMDVSGEQGEGVAYLTAVLDGARIVYIFGAAEDSEADFAAIYNAMLGTLALTTPQPVADMEVEPVAVEEPVAVAEAEPTAVPQPTAVPEPTAVSGPSYVAIDVDPGIYLYTSGDFIRDMTLYDGKVWVASLGGVVAWDVQTGTSRKYTTLDGLPHVGVYGITVCPAPEITLLAGTEDGLAAYDVARDTWYRADSVFKTEPVAGLLGVVGDDIGTLVCDAANNRLIMQHKGVTTVNLMDSSTYNVPGSDLSWSGIRHLTLIGDQIWVSSGFRGFTILEGEDVRPFSKNAATFEADTIYHIAAAPNGDIWMAASEGLIHYRNGQVAAIYNRDNTPGFATVYYVAFDPAGEMWLGTTNALCQVNVDDQSCKVLYNANQTEGMAFGEPNHILFDDAGGIYYHTFEGGLSYFNGENWQLFRENDLPIHAVQTLFDDGWGNIWMLGGTAYTLRTDLELKEEWLRFRDMGGDSIAADAEGGLWLATGRNLYHYDGFEITRRQTADGLLDSYARAVAVADDGRIWVGQENGLSIWDGTAFTTITTADDGWPEGRIQTLLADGDVMWAGTDKGLIRYQNGSSELVLHADVVGLPSPIINALALLPDGRLLVGTTAGLVYYDHASRNLQADPEVAVFINDVAASQEGEIFVASADEISGGLYIYDEEGWLHMTTADGLPTNSLRTLLLDSAGTLWVGGGYFGYGGGLMRFVP